MEYINGRNFMLYVECETLTGSVMLPVCEAKSVQLQFQSEIREATKAPKSKWSSYYYGRNSYSLSLEGFIIYSDEAIQQQLITINEALLTTNDALVTVGGVPVMDGGGYFCLENALFDWKKIKWAFEGTTTPIKWRGEVLVQQLSDMFNADGNNNAEFSTSLQGTGEPERFHTPIPTGLKKVSQTNTLPAEDAAFTASAPGSGQWVQSLVASGTPLPNGIFDVAIYGDHIQHVVKIGDTIPEIIKDLANQINQKQYQPLNPPPDVITAVANDDTLEITFDNQHSASAGYVAHTGTLRSVFISYSSPVNYDFYRVKVQQGSNEWFIDVQGTQPTIILPTGSYSLSVAGMGTDLQYSDYSETIQITVS